MRKMRIVKQVGCAILAGALVIGQIFGSGASLITAKAAESWVDTQKITNGDFETGDETGWTISGGDALTYTVKTDQWATNNTTNYLNYFAATEADITISQTVSSVSAGTYKIGYDLEGKAGDTGLTLTAASVSQALTATTGYNVWTSYETDTFTLDSTEDLTTVSYTHLTLPTNSRV